MAGESGESLTGTLGEPSGGTAMAAETVVNHPKPLAPVVQRPGFGVGPFSPSSFGMASETEFSSFSTAIGADWGMLAPAFSPVLYPKRLGLLFDASVVPLLAAAPDFANKSDQLLAISAFYTRRLVNGSQDRVHMD
jgi:hypothetical protein